MRAQVILETACGCKRIMDWDRTKRGPVMHMPLVWPLTPFDDMDIASALKHSTRTFVFEGRYDLHGDVPLPLFRERKETTA